MSKVLQQAISDMEGFFVGIAERGLMPDPIIRIGIRKLLGQRLEECKLDGNVESQQEYLEKLVANLKTRNIAEQTGKANEQHYEVPTELYTTMLGPWLKYSCCLFENEKSTLEEAEVAMLELVCKRAELDSLKPGDTVLDLGCGWGSCALYMAKKYPQLKVSCVSNSNSQREFILNKAKALGVTVDARTCDINDLSYPQNSFNRVVSNEMFEHMKNYQKLLKNISSWMKPNGKLFVHIFTHKQFAYHFTDGWMAQTFFSGGTMPSKDLLLKFNDDLTVKKQWVVNGVHYSKTLEAWLVKIDQNYSKFIGICSKIYGDKDATKWVQRWRLFNLACSELFKFDDGNEWFITHYLFEKNN